MTDTSAGKGSAEPGVPRMRVLGLVPARGGSKGVPRKNIRLLAGQPLLSYTAAAALAAQRLTRVVLSTDDREIAAVGTRAGLDVPFLRPEALARDDTPTLPVVQHALRFLEAEGESFDAVCLLQPTNPFRRSEDIDHCIEMLETTRADAVVSVLRVPLEYNPHWVFLENGNGWMRLSTGGSAPIPRRQELPAAYHRDGAIYVTRTSVVLQGDSLYGERVRGYVSDVDRSINIDTPDDWAEAELRLLARTLAGA